MKGVGRYSALHQAHQRIATQKEAGAAGKEITDRKQERRDRDQATPPKEARAGREKDAASGPAQPGRPVTARPDTLVPNAPAPGESEGHFAWRRLVTRGIERDVIRDEARQADRIPRILRTEKNVIGRSTELKSVYDRLEAEQARRSNKKSGDKDIKPEVEAPAKVEIEPER